MNFVDVPRLQESGFAREALIRIHGPRCAAWLVFTQRRRLKTAGRRIVFKIAASAKLPAWFEIAYCFVRDHRAAKWETSRRTRAGITYFVFRWKQRRIPAVLRG